MREKLLLRKQNIDLMAGFTDISLVISWQVSDQFYAIEGRRLAGKTRRLAHISCNCFPEPRGVQPC